jgi:Protein of unknown function (DUF2505)
VRFSVEHRFAAPLHAVEHSMTDPDFFAELRNLPGVEAPVLLDRRERPGSVELDVRYVFSGDLPSVARRVLGRGELAWVQRSTVDLERHRTDFTIVPEAHADLLTCAGVYLLRAAPPLPAGGAEETARTISGELRVRVPLLGGRAERAIVSGLVERLDAEAEALRRWLASHTER